MQQEIGLGPLFSSLEFDRLKSSIMIPPIDPHSPKNRLDIVAMIKNKTYKKCIKRDLSTPSKDKGLSVLMTGGLRFGE